MAGPVRHWQALTAAQVAACDDVARAQAACIIHADGPTGPQEAGAVLLRCLARVRAQGAALAWLGGLAAGIIWHRDVQFAAGAGDLWMGQVMVTVVGVGLHRAPLAVPVNDILPTRIYALVSAEDAPNYAILGWTKGHELAAANGAMSKEARAFRDARELKALGLASIDRVRDIEAVRARKAA